MRKCNQIFTNSTNICKFVQWAYEGGKEEGFYNLEERSKEWLDSLKAHLPSMKRINVLVSHDYMVTPMAIYASRLSAVWTPACWPDKTLLLVNT